jgi:hypothetical protein
MALPKRWPIGAAVLGFLALVGTGVKLATSPNPLESRADQLLAREKEFGDSMENLPSRIEELTALQSGAGFNKLPQAKQEALQHRLEELAVLKNYQDFEQELVKIPNPKTASSIRQLQEIEDQLRRLGVPANLPESLRNAESIQRHRQWQNEVRILRTAASEVESQYRTQIQRANQVLATKNEPNLPARIEEVLASAKDLKTPLKDRDKPLAPSAPLTFASVFQLSEIQGLLQEWDKLQKKLEPAGKP